MRDFYGFLDNPLGIDFEDELCEATRNYLAVRNPKMSDRVFKTYQGTIRDKYAGVDAVIYGIPVDFTFNFHGKDHMDDLGITIGDFSLGIRYGNSHNGFTRFEEPVLVIGIDADNYYVRNFMHSIVDGFKASIHAIIEEGSSAYLDWMDARPEYSC